MSLVSLCFCFEQLLLVSLNVFRDTLLEPHCATKSTLLLFAKNKAADQFAQSGQYSVLFIAKI